MLHELLDRLPYACDDFKVRFTLRDRSVWIQPEGWHIDDDGDLILDAENDDGVVYSVYELKDLLDEGGDSDFNYGSDVYIYDNDDGPFYEPLDERFYINWKRERVDVFMD